MSLQDEGESAMRSRTGPSRWSSRVKFQATPWGRVCTHRPGASLYEAQGIKYPPLEEGKTNGVGKARERENGGKSEIEMTTPAALSPLPGDNVMTRGALRTPIDEH